ncbi:MAG TPA: S9 family peptidase [Vicinamibacteria bacterium]|nr:S9 family peptidase [Vicinamibacteria bacterium]
MSLLLALALLAATRFDATEMQKLRRLADPQVSPDGKTVAWQQTDVDVKDFSRNTDIWVAPLAGGEPRRLTTDAASDTRPRWSPDGKRIAFVSARGGAGQVWVQDLAGGEPRRVTALPTEAGGVLWIDDDTLLVTSDVATSCTPQQAEATASSYDEACQKKHVDEADEGSSARVYDSLLFRHWDTWEDRRRAHLLVVEVAGGAVRDLTPGELDAPPFSLGNEDYAVSPDGTEIAFSRVDDKVPATSTNAELYVVPVEGGAPAKVAGSPGYDGSPLYSPDSSMLAFRAQMRAGYESDRWRLMVYDRRTKETRNLTETLDVHVESVAWSPDSKTLFFTAPVAARDTIYAVPAAGGPVRTVLEGHTVSDLRVTRDGRTLVAMKAAMTHPPEVYRLNVDGTGLAPVTRVNEKALLAYGLRPGESVTYEGAAGKDVQAWIVKPADFDPAKKYPLLVLIHGGPQGTWNDGWSWRWNYQLFANGGYVVFAPNPRGSIGWGQEFVDDINRDWGGRAYEDIMKGTDYAVALPYVDKERLGAAGASYGGYMVNWIAGHTDRFDALVSHDGLFDLPSMAVTTEELWFTDWEFGGPPWGPSREMYEKWNPARFVESFKTPTLVIHGEKDYRVPIDQGIAMFTALQRRGVPSRLVVFPDENHWVLKPVNNVRWYQEVLGWLDRWVKAGGGSGGAVSPQTQKARRIHSAAP